MLSVIAELLVTIMRHAVPCSQMGFFKTEHS